MFETIIPVTPFKHLKFSSSKFITMKIFIVLFSLAVGVAVTNSAPATSRQVDWEGVIDVWFQMRGDFTRSAQKILATVMEENEQVGYIVKTKIETGATVISLLFSSLADRIGAEELTEDEAKYHIGALIGAYFTMQTELHDLNYFLTPVTREIINETFIELLATLNKQAEVLYELLRQDY